MHSDKVAMAERGVLVADDKLNMRKTRAEILWDEGSQVTTAGTGEDAIAVNRRCPHHASRGCIERTH
jgi:CheY-like chemotaxis protein